MIAAAGVLKGHIVTLSIVTEIGSAAFVGCTALTRVVIPDSVTEIGHSTFFGISPDAHFTVTNESPRRKRRGIV